MLGVLPKSQGIAEKKMTSQTQDHLFACYSLFFISFFILFFLLYAFQGEPFHRELASLPR